MLLILFSSPSVSWWGLCCSSYLVHLRCFGGARVAHLIRFTSGVLVGPVLLILFGSSPVFWWGLVLLILFGSPPVSWWGPCCSSYSVHLRCFGGARVAHLIRFTSGVLVGPVLLILFGSPPVFWWGPCCSSYSVHLRCFGGARVAHLIRFTSGVLVGPVLLILFVFCVVLFFFVLCFVRQMLPVSLGNSVHSM